MYSMQPITACPSAAGDSFLSPAVAAKFHSVSQPVGSGQCEKRWENLESAPDSIRFITFRSDAQNASSESSALSRGTAVAGWIWVPEANSSATVSAMALRMFTGAWLSLQIAWHSVLPIVFAEMRAQDIVYDSTQLHLDFVHCKARLIAR